MKKNSAFEFNMFMFIMVFMFLAIFEGAVRDTGRVSTLLGVLTAVVLYLWVCLEFRRRRISLRSFTGPLKFKPGWAPCCLPADIVSTTIFFLQGCSSLLSFIFSQGGVHYLNERSELSFLTLVVRAPITEEFFFRGLPINIGRRGIKRSLILSAICFAMMHGRTRAYPPLWRGYPGVSLYKKRFPHTSHPLSYGLQYIGVYS